MKLNIPERAFARLKELNIKLFADGANLKQILALNELSIIEGFTTNPTLMRQSNIAHYETFCREVLAHITNKPICFEVISDNLLEMKQQAQTIASWGNNIFVKLPASTTLGESSATIAHELSHLGIKLNITAVMTLEQVQQFQLALCPETPAMISVFAGRIADTGRDPIPLMETIKHTLNDSPQIELLWASPRELLNVFQADACQCDIITLSDGLLAKLQLINKPLDEFSQETVAMFYRDACSAEYSICTLTHA